MSPRMERVYKLIESEPTHASRADPRRERNGKRTGGAKRSFSGTSQRPAFCARGVFRAGANPGGIRVVRIHQGSVYRSHAGQARPDGIGQWGHLVPG